MCIHCSCVLCLGQLLKSQSVYAQVVQPNWSGDMIDEEVNKWRNQVGVSAVLGRVCVCVCVCVLVLCMCVG